MSDKDFTRNRKLTFSKMVLIMLRKGVKSLQNSLNETQKILNNLIGEDLTTITKSAYTQARDKLNYKAFIELSNDIRDKFYKEYDYKTYKGYRLLGVDGSLITLPNEDDIKKEFNTTSVVNQHKDKSKEIVQARVSVVYDLLNSVVIDAVLTNSKTHEIHISKNDHFKNLEKKDLVIFDRNYPSYEMFALLNKKHNVDYLMRIKTSTYKEYTKELFNKDSKVKDKIVTIKPNTKKLREEITSQNLPLEIQVRFVQVILPNGDVEVLATSILDYNILKTSDFKELYFKRWRVETYYEILKNRLSLENFTGKTALSIKQDFYSSIFVSNIEALLVYDINEDLEKQTNKYKYQINKSVSINTIKNHIFEMFYSTTDMEQILDNLYLLLSMDKVPIRPNRQFRRPTRDESKVSKGIKSANFQKRKKKSVF